MDFCDLLSFHPVCTDPKNSAKIYFACDEETFNTHFEAIEQLLILFGESPDDKHLALALSQLLGVNPNQQEEET